MTPATVCADALRSGFMFAAVTILMLFAVIVGQYNRIRYLERKDRP